MLGLFLNTTATWFPAIVYFVNSCWSYIIVLIVLNHLWPGLEYFWDFIISNSLFHWFLQNLHIFSHCIALRQSFAWPAFEYFWNLILSNSLFHWFSRKLYLLISCCIKTGSFAWLVFESFWNRILRNSLFHRFLLKLYICSTCIKLRQKALLGFILNTDEILL